MRSTIAALLVLCCGCSAQSDGIKVSGQVMLDGVATAGEILIEPLQVEDQPTLVPVTVFADSSGRFSAVIAQEPESPDEVPCRVVVRVAIPTDSEVPASLNEQAAPDRVVTLRRSLRDGQTLTLLLTH